MVSTEAVLQPQGIKDETPDDPIHSLTQLLDHRAEHRGDQPGWENHNDITPKAL